MLKGTVICFFVFIQISVAQKNDTSLYIFRNAEEELKQLQQKTFYSKKEADRFAGNREFLAVWDRIASDPRIIRYPFDSLRDVSVLIPHDKKFRLITWNVHRDDGTHAYFGYLFVNNSKRVKTGFLKHETQHAYEYFKLIDKSALLKSPENYTGTPEKWFGMLYYSVIECDGFYTLLGYDLNDNLTRRKFVDVLYFKTDGTPVFGKDVFKFPRKNPRRLMFEYSSDVTMSLKYNERRRQIVYSHLGSKQEGSLLENQYQYYGPDGSYDALELKKDKWVTIEDVDARNEKSENDNAKKPDPKRQTPLYKPK
jgi:hypothetical protein